MQSVVISASMAALFAVGQLGAEPLQPNNHLKEVSTMTQADGAGLPDPQFIKSQDVDTGDLFGYAIAVSGDTLVISAAEEDSAAIGVDGDLFDESVLDAGAAYVYTRQDGEWEYSAYLKASNTGVRDWFGEAVAIDGDTIAVSAILEDSNATGVNGNEADNSVQDSGAVYIYRRMNDTWVQEAYVKPTDPGNYGDDFREDRFGRRLDISGNTLVVGAPRKGGIASTVHYGAIYVFERIAGSWTETAYFDLASPRARDRFGSSVKISGDTIVVGAPGEDKAIKDAGAAYVYRRVDGVWEQEARLEAPSPQENGAFGFSVDVDADTIVVGAAQENRGSAESAGAAYVFRRRDGQWVPDERLQPDSLEQSDFFGAKVYLAGSNIVVGAPNKITTIDGITSATGAAYHFRIVDGQWNLSSILTPSYPDNGDQFSDTGGISESDIVLGVYLEDSSAESAESGFPDNSKKNSGGAYAFKLPSGYDIRPEHTALWYNPDQNGHGLSVYVVDANQLVAIWYVYDNSGDPLWLIGTGSYDGALATLSVQAASGAQFPPNFIPSDVALSDWGQFELRFESCDDAAFSWEPNDAETYTSGEMDLQRLTTTFGLPCSDGGLAAKGQMEGMFDPSQSALWYDPDQPGHGYSVYLLEDSQIVVVWYVFDNEGSPLWLIGSGSHDGSTATVEVNSASGAMFPPLFSADDVKLAPWGTMTVQFTDCDSGVFSWSPLDGNGFSAGEASVIRLTNSPGLTCDS